MSPPNRTLGILRLGLTGLAAIFLVGGLVSCRATITEILQRASQGDPDSKREAIVRLGELLAQKEASGFTFNEGELGALEYIKDVASQDPEAMNRMRAITALRGLKSFDFTEIYLDALKAPYWGVRWEAAKALRDRPRADASPAILARLRAESRPEVLVDLVKCLAAIGDRTSVRGLLEVYLDRSGRYRDNRLKAYEALARLSGRDWAYEEYERWDEYYRLNFPPGDKKPVESGRKASPADPASKAGADEGARGRS